MTRSLAWRTRLLLAALVCAAYANSLNGPFQFDDHGVLQRDPTLHTLGAHWLGGLRPLLKLSYALCWSLGEGRTWVFHVFNLLVHLVNVELVMRLYGMASAREQASPVLRPSFGAALAGVLFGVHPIQTEAVTYITGRSASLATLFALLALLFHVSGRRSGQRALSWGVAPLCFVAAVLTKEAAAVLPLGFALWDALIERLPARRVLRYQLGYWLVGAGLFVAAVMNARYFSLLYRVLGQRSLTESLRFQLGGLWYLAERLLLLRRPCIDPGLWLAAPSQSRVLGSAACVVALLTLGLWQARRRPLLLFGVGWFLLLTFVPYVVLPRVDVINERHAYLANAGLFLALASLGAELGLAAVARGAVLVGFAATLGFLTFQRNREYSSEVALWRSTVAVAPKNPRAQNNLGVAYETSGRIPEARIAYTRALALEPRFMAARKNMLRVLQR